jgi:hypothetical protein
VIHQPLFAGTCRRLAMRLCWQCFVVKGLQEEVWGIAMCRQGF